MVLFLSLAGKAEKGKKQEGGNGEQPSRQLDASVEWWIAPPNERRHKVYPGEVIVNILPWNPRSELDVVRVKVNAEHANGNGHRHVNEGQ